MSDTSSEEAIVNINASDTAKLVHSLPPHMRSRHARTAATDATDPTTRPTSPPTTPAVRRRRAMAATEPVATRPTGLVPTAGETPVSDPTETGFRPLDLTA